MNLKERLLNEFRKRSNASELELSDRTINETIDLLGLPEEDKVDEFVEKYGGIFDTITGQSKRNIAKLQSEKELAIQEAKDALKPKDKEEKEDKGMNKTNKELMAEMMAEMKAEMKAELDALKQARSIEGTREQLLKFAKEAGFSDDYVLNTTLKGLDLTKDVEEVKKELEQNYANEFKACRNVEPPKASGKGGGDDEDKDLADFIKRKEAKDKYYETKIND